MKVKRESEVVQSCPTLSDPIACSLLGSPVHGIFQGVLEWGAIALAKSTQKCWGQKSLENSSYRTKAEKKKGEDIR